MKKYILINACMLLGLLSGFKANAIGKYAGYITHQDTGVLKHPDAVLFCPGVISTAAISSAAPTFTPDGRSVYIGQSQKGKDISIMVSHLADGKWFAPTVADFSGKYRDLEPVFAPDGKYLVFASNRPATPGVTELEGNYNGKKFPGGGGNLWKVKRTKNGWETPEVLPAVINSNSSVFSPAITGDGSLYFMRSDSGKAFHIFRSRMQNGKFEQPVPASFTDPEYGDFDPAVSPNESFIIFCSPRPPAPPHTADLFIVFRNGNGWSEPIDLRQAISENVYGVEARLSPDCKILYFSNQRNASGVKDPNSSYTWMVDISGVLKEHGVK
jgi:Tol biopolymer transport system component